MDQVTYDSMMTTGLKELYSISVSQHEEAKLRRRELTLRWRLWLSRRRSNFMMNAACRQQDDAGVNAGGDRWALGQEEIMEWTMMPRVGRRFHCLDKG